MTFRGQMDLWVNVEVSAGCPSSQWKMKEKLVVLAETIKRERSGDLTNLAFSPEWATGGQPHEQYPLGKVPL